MTTAGRRRTGRYDPSELLTASPLESEDGVVVAHFSGEVDLSTAAAFRAQLETAVRTDGARRLVVDMTAVTFMDSTGVSELVHARRLCHTNALDLTVLCSMQIERILGVSGLRDVFND